MKPRFSLLLAATILTTTVSALAADAAPPKHDGDPAATIPLSEPAKAAVLYTKANAPAAPKLEDLPLKESVTQYGITWTFEKPARVGQFVTGDSYVVGPVTVKAVSPKPLFGAEVKDTSDVEAKAFGADHLGRNGSVLNLSATALPAYDSRVYEARRYDPNRFVRFPQALKPGDSLISTISAAHFGPGKDRNRERMMGPSDHTNVSAVQAAAILTCVAAPLPPDAFRPAFCDRSAKVYYARDLKRDLLPKLAPPAVGPGIEYMIRVFERPWIDTVFFEFCNPVDNMPQYGREVGRAASLGTAMLCCDFDALLKERLLQGIVQAGIDYWGAVRDGHPGWQAHGGHGEGRKWVLVFAGILLGDADMQNPYAKYPDLKFSEDMQTVYGQGWTGATALYGGHVGPAGSKSAKGWGLYENLPPEKWEAELGEGYRYCCTSICWVGQALAIRLLKAEKTWNHDAFLDYCDRWMYEDDTEFNKKVVAAKGPQWDKSGSPQGRTWDKFVDQMWAKYRTAPGMPPTDGWKKPHPSPGSSPATAGS